MVRCTRANSAGVSQELDGDEEMCDDVGDGSVCSEQKRIQSDMSYHRKFLIAKGFVVFICTSSTFFLVEICFGKLPQQFLIER